MRRLCSVCGLHFEAKRKDAVTCSASCRSRKRHIVPPSDPAANSLVKATQAELETAGKLDTMLGQQALALAARMSGSESVAGIASLSKELRTVMAAAIGTSPAVPTPGVAADVVDEVRARRDAKRAG